MSSAVSQVSPFRRILPQVLACVAKSLILVDIGLALGFPTTLISALSASDNGFLHFDPDQSSWFASLLYISQPVGCVFSGWLTDRLGRKKAMILVNVPHIGAWLLIHFATEVREIYAAAIILGLGIGVMETPVVTYIGEIWWVHSIHSTFAIVRLTSLTLSRLTSQPSIRGILTSTTGVAVTLGYTMVYSLGWMFYWRTVALICFTVPVLTILVILLVPETPLWLLMHDRVEAARKSLQWLRGWVSAGAVQEELNELQRYCSASRKCKLCEEEEEGGSLCGCQARDTWRERWIRFTATKNAKPFCVVTLFLVFAQLSGFAAMRPYLVPILKRFHVPMDADQAMSIIGLLKLSANLTIMASVKWAGKRRLSLISAFGVASCTLSLGAYAKWFMVDAADSGLFPLLAVFSLAFLTSLGFAPIPWILLSEVLPLRTRAITSGVAVTINYLVVFMVTKTYPGLEQLLDLNGVLWLYFCFGAGGFLFLYVFLPETENRTLEEIEKHFATRPMTETVIRPIEEKSVDVVKDDGKPDDGVKCREDLELL